MESELEAQERLFRQQQQQHVPNPPMPVKEVPKPKNKRVKKKVQRSEYKHFLKGLKLLRPKRILELNSFKNL